MITIKSPELKNIKHLNEFLEENVNEQITEETNCFALWGTQSLELIGSDPKVEAQPGREPSKDDASVAPAQEKIVIEEKKIDPSTLFPVLRLTKGLFSSYSPDDSPLSLYYAYQSDVYYNFTKESNIESLLTSNWLPTEQDWMTATKAIQMIKKYGITKYNSYPAVPETVIAGGHIPSLLLVDQPVDDDSVKYGNASAKTFKEMLFHAFDNYPYSTIYIKLHPETIDGKKEGYLHNLLKEHGLNDHPSIRLIDTHCNITTLFDAVDEVFVVTSQVGFEALIRDKRVTCFGTPFYSGWGLTNDMQTLTYPKPQRSVMDLFIAIAIEHTLYLNPFTNKKGSILDLLEYISLQKRHENKKNVVFYKTEMANAKHIDIILNTDKKQHILLNSHKKLRKYDPCLILSDKKDTFKDVEKHSHRAFIGESFLFPLTNSSKDILSLIIDYNGAYYDPNGASDLDYMLNYETYTDYERECADKFIDALKVRYLVGSRTEVANDLIAAKMESGKKKVIVAPGQNEKHDMTVTGGDIVVPSDYYLLLSICEKEKNSLIVYKPDESSKIKKINDFGKEGFLNLKHLCGENNNTILIERSARLSQCIDIADEVHVINHNCGLEALIKGKKVITYGFPFYGGHGLTEDRQRYTSHKRQLTLQELVLAAHVLYPRYKAPSHNGFINALTAIEHDKNKSSFSWNNSFFARIAQKIKSVF